MVNFRLFIVLAAFISALSGCATLPPRVGKLANEDLGIKIGQPLPDDLRLPTGAKEQRYSDRVDYSIRVHGSKQENDHSEELSVEIHDGQAWLTCHTTHEEGMVGLEFVGVGMNEIRLRVERPIRSLPELETLLASVPSSAQSDSMRRRIDESAAIAKAIGQNHPKKSSAGWTATKFEASPVSTKLTRYEVATLADGVISLRESGETRIATVPLTLCVWLGLAEP